MKQRRWLWFGSFVIVVLVLIALIGSSTQTALMQTPLGISRETAVLQSIQIGTGKTAVNITAVDALIPDGSFEERPSLWTEWDNYNCTSTSIENWSSITGFPARDGSLSFWAGGRCGDQLGIVSNYAEQSITIPTDSPGLSFWYYSYNQELNPTYADIAYVDLFDPFNETYYRAWSIDMIPETNTNGWVYTSVDLTPFAGSTMTLTVGGNNSQAGMVDGYAGSVFFDLFEFTEPPPTNSEIMPGSGGSLQYNDPYTGNPVTEVQVPAGAVDSRTIMRYVPATTPGHPLYPAGESPLGTSLTFAGIAFDLEAFDQFIYLPLVINGEGTTSKTSASNIQEVTSPEADGVINSFQFNLPLTIKIYYDENTIGVPEDQLYLYYWTGDGWADAATTCAVEDQLIPAYNRDLVNNWFELNVCHFSRFGTVG